MRLLISALALVLLWGETARPATLEKLTLDDMTAKSTAIVRGRAVSNSPRMIGSSVYTDTRFQVLETWKGPSSPEVTVTELGGTLGTLTQNYAGVPRFAPGDEMVLFLRTGPSGRTQVIGLTQGIYQVNRSGDRVMVKQEPSSGVILSPGTGAPSQVQETNMALSTLAARVRSSKGPLPK
jgi:hypothetical protein